MNLLGGFKADRLINQVVLSNNLESDSASKAISQLRGISKNAVPKIIGLLSTAGREETGLMVKLLTKLADRSTLEYYLQGLANSDRRVVAGVVEALKKTHNIDPNRFLELFDNPDVSKSAILEVLSAHKATIHGENLLRHGSKLGHHDLVALFRIIEDIADEQLVPKLISRIGGKDSVMRAQIARVFARFKSKEVHDALLTLLEDENKTVRLAALEALSEMDASLDIHKLCQLLKDPDLKIHGKAIDVIVKLDHPDTVRYLLDPLKDESEYARRAAVEVLNEIGNINAIKDLLIAIKDQDWWVRSRAADALGKIGGKRVVDAIIELIKDDDEYVRRTAIEIINATQDSRTYETLLDALGDTDWWVRERAIDGLGKLGNKRAIPVLIKMLSQEQPNEEMDILVIKALGSLGSNAVIPPLLEQLKLGSANIQLEALSALAEVTDESQVPDVVGEIQKVTEGATEDVKQLAAKITQKLKALLTYTATAISADKDLTGSGPAQATEIHSRATVILSENASSDVSSRPVNNAQDVDPSLLQPDDILAERYRFIKLVGKGAFGSVFLMEDLMVKEQLVLKFLDPKLASDESIMKRFVYELRFARKITHPNVIRIYDMVTFGNNAAISMEYFPSHTLSAEIRGKAMDIEYAAEVINHVCTGMAIAHEANVVHRDLKPGNILISNEKLVKVVDFGIAAASRQGDTRLTKTGLLVGTPTYMAPEQVLGRNVDARTDIYSLGVIMYEMLTGKTPYSGDDSMSIMYQHVQGQAKSPDKVNINIPRAISAVVEKAMATDPDKRFQSMDELRRSLCTALT